MSAALRGLAGSGCKTYLQLESGLDTDTGVLLGELHRTGVLVFGVRVLPAQKGDSGSLA